MSATATQVTQLTAPNHTIEAPNGVSYAYRRLGEPSASAPPLVLLQHFRGNLDNWDSALVDALARTRGVILFDNAGVGGSTGTVPRTVTAMAHDALAFIDALELRAIDVLGFSLGGYVAQVFALRHSPLVRSLMLLGTGPRAREGQVDPRVTQVAGTPVLTLDVFLYLFFSPSEASQAAGRAFWERRHQRVLDVDPPSSVETQKAQIAALMEWREIRGERFAELKNIHQPTLVVNGHNDVMVPSINSYILSQHIPNAQLIVYPDSGHAAQFQYPDLFMAHARLFLAGMPH